MLESARNTYEKGGIPVSVIMTLNVTGDPKKMEQFASENKEKMQAVLEAAKGHGLIAHRFYGSDDGGRLMVLDEWPDRQSFESFFREQQAEIGPMMEAAGVTSQPEPACWNEPSRRTTPTAGAPELHSPLGAHSLTLAHATFPAARLASAARPQAVGSSPAVCANVLLTICQRPSIFARAKKFVNEIPPQQPSSSTTAVAASATCTTDAIRAS